MTRRAGESPFRRSTKLAGSFLLAHPGLLDPNFHKTVVLLSAHTDESAMGVIINRPLDKKLADISGDFALGELAEVPVFCGGPVFDKQLILSAWEASEEEGVFKLYFGLDPEKAMELKRTNPAVEVRAFLGYAGWENGQLEGELQQKAWVVSPMDGELIRSEEGEAMWRQLIGRVSPEMRLLANAPDDPELN